MVDNLTSPAFVKNAGIKAENIRNITTIYSYKKSNFLIKEVCFCTGISSYSLEEKINILKSRAGKFELNVE